MARSPRSATDLKRSGLFLFKLPSLFGLALALLQVGGVSAEAQEKPKSDARPLLTFMTEHRPPNNYLDGQTGRVAGRNTEMLRKTLEMTGLSAKFEIAQWSRSYGAALTTADTCVYSTVRNDRREPLFKWVGPLNETFFALIALKSSKLRPLADLEAARPYRIGVFSQDVREKTLRHMGGFDIDVAAEDRLNARKLINGRIDIWFSDLDALDELLPEQRAKMEVVLRMKPKRLFLACNRGVADEIIDAMNAALRKLR